MVQGGCEQHKVIDVHHGSQSESWLVVYEDGRIQLHSENEGYRFMRRGPEATERWLDLAEVEQLAFQHGKPLVEQVLAALVEFTRPAE
jgi:hypothetical protein